MEPANSLPKEEGKNKEATPVTIKKEIEIRQRVKRLFQHLDTLNP